MYLDSDTKVIISGAVILLVGIIVWKKQSFFIALVFCVLCFVYQSVYDVFSDSYAIILGRAGKFFLFYISCC